MFTITPGLTFIKVSRQERYALGVNCETPMGWGFVPIAFMDKPDELPDILDELSGTIIGFGRLWGAKAFKKEDVPNIVKKLFGDFL